MNFNYYSQYYDLLYHDKDYASEVNYIDSLIKKYKSGGKTILEFGCGTGIHAKLLTEIGYNIQGIEKSPAMVELANQRNVNNNFSILLGDISETVFNQKYDSVISLFHVISYINENEQLLKVFKNARNHLNERGLFIFDVWYTPAVFHSKPECRLKKIENDEITITRFAEPKINYRSNVIDVNYKLLIKKKIDSFIHEIEETHSMRHFSEPEISLLAEMTGFEVLNAEEFLSGNEPSEKSWGVCFVLRRTK